MAIFVSNPTSAAVPTPPSDTLDPSVIAPEEGFTEELAAAMQPAAVPSDATEKISSDLHEELGHKVSGLQILPAEVLLNAVGDANFAFSGQADADLSVTGDTAPGSALAEAILAEEQEAVVLDLANQLQGAELAAANLAAQMSASVANVPAPLASNSAEVSAALSISATSEQGQEVGHASQAPTTGSDMLEGAPVSSVSTLASPQNKPSLSTESHNAANASAESQAARMATLTTAQAEPATSDPSNATRNLSQLNAPVIANQLATQGETQVAVNPSLTLKATAANEAGPYSTPLAALTVANLSGTSVVKADAKTEALQTGFIHSSTPAESLVLTNLATEKSNASPNPKADTQAIQATQATQTTQATQAQESAFNFDAKLTKAESLKSPKAPETALSLAAAAKSNAQVQSTSLLLNDALAAAQATADSSTSVTAVLGQEAPRPETTQSLEDVSPSFVSSLVGGPQRPVNTVMDWISMRSQERAAPLVPHEVRLDAGAVQLEIQKMVRQGGGHVVMELTPPDQSKFTIELKLDERGGALLIVEGVSDSTKTRLEQSAPQLREQFQQMGLELQLDMRQQGQSASSNAADFAFSQERGFGDNNAANNGAGDTPKVLTPREAGANRAREAGSNQVYLYA